MITEPRGFGWKKDPHDARDRMHARRAGLTRIEGRRMDGLVQKVRDQGQTGSCVGHACVSGLELLYALEGRGITPLSPMHAYWNARARDGFQHEDGGAYIRSCLTVMRAVGCCAESELPLDAETINDKPPQRAENAGIRFADFRYERIAGGPEHVLDALQSGFPVVMGTNVTSAFVFCSDDQTIPAPKRGDVRQGGHAFLLVGFDRRGERIRMLNSWGGREPGGWGDAGFAWLDPGWIEDPTTQDVIALVSTAKPRTEGA